MSRRRPEPVAVRDRAVTIVATAVRPAPSRRGQLGNSRSINAAAQPVTHEHEQGDGDSTSFDPLIRALHHRSKICVGDAIGAAVGSREEHTQPSGERLGKPSRPTTISRDQRPRCPWSSASAGISRTAAQRSAMMERPPNFFLIGWPLSGDDECVALAISRPRRNHLLELSTRLPHVIHAPRALAFPQAVRSGIATTPHLH